MPKTPKTARKAEEDKPPKTNEKTKSGSSRLTQNLREAINSKSATRKNKQIDNVTPLERSNNVLARK